MASLKMSASNSHMSQLMDGPSWSSPSASPSPPPPPLPPPVAARWNRNEQANNESCPHCRGRLTSLPTRTTSLSSYTCKDRNTPIHRPPDDEDSFPVIHERELHSLHRNIPALRRRDVDTATIKQHYYPEGGWGWLVCGAAFLAHLLTSGIQLSYGLLYLYTIKFLLNKFRDNDIYILGGESDHIVPEENPPFNTELVWEIEKKELRKIRSANIPLRVECITIDSQSRKERIGFALLSLRCAQIIPESKATEPIVPAWYKLIGCQADKRKSHPELYMSLSLRDHLINEQAEVEEIEDSMPFILEEGAQNLEDNSIESGDCAVKYFENGHIQIGDASTATDKFTFIVLVKDAVNLDALLPEALVFQNNSGSFFLTFKILGITIKTKSFQKQMESIITLNERIVINLFSKRDILEEFFQTQVIVINFYNAYDKLGITKFTCSNIWEHTEQKHFFKFPSPNGLVPFGCTKKSPYITLETWIEEIPASPVQLSPIERPLTPEEVTDKPKNKTRSIFSNMWKKSRTSIEAAVENLNLEGSELESLSHRSTHGSNSQRSPLLLNSQRSPHESHRAQVDSHRAQVDSHRSPHEPPKAAPSSEVQIAPFVAKSVDTVVVNDPLTARSCKVTDHYEKFVVVVSLKYLMWITQPPDTKIMFKFLHPRAGSCTTIFTEISNIVQQEIALNNLFVRIGYISTIDKISKLLKYWYPKFALADENESYITDQRPLNINCLESKYKDYEIECRNLRSGVPLARIGVNVTISITDAELEDDYENLYLLPVILDEIITVNEITDLMKWKNDNQIEFEKQLEDIKQQEIKRLDEDYKQRKVILEEKVNKTIEKCKEVQNDLKSKLAALKIEKELKKMADNYHGYEEIYQSNYKSYSKDNTQEIIEILSKTQRDNEILKKLVEEYREKVSQTEKSTVTKVETNGLLKELSNLEAKFSRIQTAKHTFTEKLKIAKIDEKIEKDVSRNDFKAKDIPSFYTESSRSVEIIEAINNELSERNY